MIIKFKILAALCFTILRISVTNGQQANNDSLVLIKEKIISKVNTSATAYCDKIDRQTEKYINKIQKQEASLRKKLAKKDSTAAKQLFDDAAARYKLLTAKIRGKYSKLNRNAITDYIPGLDTTLTSLKFLKENRDIAGNAKKAIQGIDNAIIEYETLQQKMKNADELKQFLRERKQHLKDVLSKYGLDKYMKKYDKGVWYYAAQIGEYRAALNDPAKAEQKIIQLLGKIPAFKEFMNQNGLLSGIFGSSPATGTMPPDLTGLQSRVQVQQFISMQAGGPGNLPAVQQTLQNAQRQMSVLQSRFTQWGNSRQDIEMPNFQPNSQKTKPFLKRLEYGTSINTNRGRGVFPNTADIALTIGYKLSDRFVTGLGVNTKTGLGNGLNKIKFSYEGIGGRTYLDWKIPKSKFWLTGGYELNHFSHFKNITELKNLDAWQHSCLFGLTKKVQLKGKGIKVQLLWDALANQHIPNTSKFLYRVVITK